MHLSNKFFYLLIIIFISSFAISAYVYMATTPGSGLQNIIPEKSSAQYNNSSLLSLEQKNTLTNFTYYQIAKSFNQQTGLEPNIPEIFDYNYIYFSLYNNNQLRCRKKNYKDSFPNNNLKNDLTEAIERCLEDNRFGGPIKAQEIDNIEIVMNLLHDKKNINNRTAQQDIEPGIHAVELITANNKDAFYNSGTALIKNYDSEEILERLCEIAKQNDNCYKNKSNKIFKYSAVTFKSNKKNKITDLYRYNPIISLNEINNEYLLQRLKYAQQWLINNTDQNNKRFYYKYYPKSDSHSDDEQHVRQLATAWAASELENYLNDYQLKSTVTHIIDYYLNTYSVCNDNYCYIDTEGKTKLAYNAFLIQILLNVPNYPDQQKWLDLLASGILNQQQADGSYKTYFNSDRNTGTDFYPGEAMYALMNLYNTAGQEKYLNSVEKAFYYYRDYWRKNKKSAFIPWHSQAYLHLYNHTKNKEVADFTFEINDWLIDNKQTLKSDYPDFIGGFHRPKPGNVTGVDLEGVLDAYELAIEAGDQEHIEKYKNSALLGIKFLMTLQYYPENTFYLPNPEQAVGGFRKSLTDNTQRMDYTQHCSFAIMKAIDLNLFK